MKAYWKKGAHHKVDATKAYKEIERIKSKHNGSVIPEVLVIEAEKSSNPLHKEFEWDNSAAAHQYRLQQARGILRHIEVVLIESPQTRERAYQPVTQEAVRDMPERKVYKSTQEILQDPILRDEVLARAIRDAITYRRKYAQLQELSKVFSEIDNFLMTASAA